MQFEWDEAKNLDNIRKHEIDFADIPEMFENPILIELDDRFDYGEDRWIGIGFLGNGVAVVVWTERQNDVIRSFQHEGQIDMSDKDLNNTSRTNWAALEAMNDEEIDYSDIPPLTEEFFEKATLRIPASQAQQLVQIDPDIIKWFQAQGGEYKTLINSVLRRYIESNGQQSAVQS